jgi:hypothetical protein
MTSNNQQSISNVADGNASAEAANSQDMPTAKYPGVLDVLLACSLSPSQVCSENTSDAHPMKRFRISIASMGIVEDTLDVKSAAFSRGRGCWYGTTGGIHYGQFSMQSRKLSLAVLSRNEWWEAVYLGPVSAYPFAMPF